MFDIESASVGRSPDSFSPGPGDAALLTTARIPGEFLRRIR
jgi:hypothetical protein